MQTSVEASVKVIMAVQLNNRSSRAVFSEETRLSNLSSHVVDDLRLIADDRGQLSVSVTASALNSTKTLYCITSAE